MKHIQKNKRGFLNGQQGGILPLVLLSILLLEISFLGAFRIYQNKMHTYEMLVDHYQSQTLFAYTEKIIKDDFLLFGRKVPKSMNFNIGIVEIGTLSSEAYLFTSRLTNGFSEKKEMKITKPFSPNDVPPKEEERKAQITIIKITRGWDKTPAPFLLLNDFL